MRAVMQSESLRWNVRVTGLAVRADTERTMTSKRTAGRPIANFGFSPYSQPHHRRTPYDGIRHALGPRINSRSFFPVLPQNFINLLAHFAMLI
jgi:hypothetical protein